MTIAVVNVGELLTGALGLPQLDADALICDEDSIAWIGSTAEVSRADHPTVVDAGGAAVAPGLIDSHVHTTFGDYSPRQQTIGFLESYVHGGVTRAISASEVHVPGRPTDIVGVKALAIAAERSFREYRPGGMAVHGGAVILEPGMESVDFRELREAGVRFAKAGFGAFDNSLGYVPVVAAARQEGIIVMCHTGGGSISGSQERIDAEALLAMRPDVAGHVNGGPTAMSSEDNRTIVHDTSEIALQIVQAGNLRSGIEIAEMALEKGEPHRLLLASDTPTGTGVIPLAMLRNMAEMVSLGPMTPQVALAASTGSVAGVYGVPGGRIEIGAAADLVVFDAPIGSHAPDWAEALRLGDLLGVGVVITAGEIRLAKSRNTPPPRREVSVVYG